MEVRLLSSARYNLRNIESYLEEISDRSTAKAVTQRIVDAIKTLATPGLLGTDRGNLSLGLRSTPHRNYIIFFRYTHDAVEIVNVLHGSRDIGAFYDAP